MFTIDQIKAAHAKVKSGADFPNYIQDVILLGVEGYETFVADGHTLFQGQDGFTAQSEPKYATLIIADSSNQSQFQRDLQEHQQGKTDYLTFCRACASYGVEKWIVSMADMTCSYYDKAGNTLLVEVIPH
jgi:uncharacterized protein YbcV (DUF1398 family)